MSACNDAPPPVRFGPFALDLAQGLLRRDGVPVDVPPRPFALLCHLVRNAGRVVPKHELLDAVWGHEHLSASSLKATVNNLRRALGEDARAGRWIISVARRGYRFEAAADAPGAALPAGAAPLAPPPAPPAGPPAAPAPEPSADASAHDGLIGRQAEHARLRALLASARVVTLLGPAGIGKTQLALAALPALAAVVPDGAWLVRLEAIRDADTLVATLAHALQLSAEAARDLDALALALHTLSMGLVLDNCEHLNEVLPGVLKRLLAESPGLRLLCTSQRPLGLAEEALLPLAPLSLPAADGHDLERSAAAQLLLARLRMRDRGFQLDPSQRPAVAAICRGLDGVPLELELAAARVPLLGLAGVQARLADRLDLLRQSGPDTQHHRSLRAAFAWSHALLSQPQQQVLRRLSVFEGSFSAEAAQAVVAQAPTPAPDGAGAAAAGPGPDGWDVLDAIGALAERSLLVSAGDLPGLPARSARGGEAAPLAPVPRWRMLNGIRVFAEEQLAAAGEREAWRERHAQWMAALLARRSAEWADRPVLQSTQALEPEVDNLRAALRHAQRHDPALARRLWAHGVQFWVRSGRRHEALRWMRALGLQPAPVPGAGPADGGRPGPAGALQAIVPGALPVDSADPVLRALAAQPAAPDAPALDAAEQAQQAAIAQALGVLCVMGVALPPQPGLAAIDRALALHQALGQPAEAYYDLFLKAMVLIRLQQPVLGSGVLEAMQALESPQWSHLRRRGARWAAAMARRQAGQTAAYLQAMRDELAFARQADDHHTIWSTGYAVALASHDQGDPAAALAQLGQLWEDIGAAGAQRSQPQVAGVLAAMLLWHGADTAASSRVDELIALLRADGTLWSLAPALPWRAWWAGRAEDAARLLGWADARVAAAGERRGPFFSRLHADLEARLAEALPAAQVAALRAEGERLAETAALGLVGAAG